MKLCLKALSFDCTSFQHLTCTRLKPRMCPISCITTLFRPSPIKTCHASWGGTDASAPSHRYRMQRLMTHDSRDSAPTSKPERILLAASPNNPLHLELQCGQRLPCREQQRPSVNTMSWHLHRAHLSRLSRDGHHLSPLPPVHIPSLGSLARLADVARDLRVPRLLCMPRCLDRFVRRKPKKTTSESLDVF